jgi:hypothetical protein
MNMEGAREMTVNQGNWCQEWYSTGSGEARKRAAQLRKLGYVVTTSSMGTQITDVGAMKMTLVDIRPGSNPDTFGLAEVRDIEWQLRYGEQETPEVARYLGYAEKEN